MKSNDFTSLFRLNRTEILFFAIFFFVFPIIADVEFNIYEPFAPGLSYELLIERIVWGLIGLVPYLVYYKVVIPNLFKRKYLRYVLLLGLFLVFLNLYKIYVEYWLISQLTFLPDDMVRSAEKWFNVPSVLFRFSIIYIFRELLMITALAYFLHASKQDKEMHALRQQQLESELKYLKIQLQPHFFFNTLNNIYALALEKSDRTAPLIALHAEMMRYILYHSRYQTVPLSKEVTFLQNYSEAEAIRHEESTKIIFDAQGIDDSYSIEPLLLLPFVENAFKHGLEEETNAGFVEIIICCIDQQLTMEVRNSKIQGKNPNLESKGIGLANVRDRLRILYPEHQLKIENNDQTYQVRLTINLAKNG